MPRDDWSPEDSQKYDELVLNALDKQMRAHRLIEQAHDLMGPAAGIVDKYKGEPVTI
jgi:hypothetical protein